MLVKNILNVIEKSYSVLSDQGEWVCTNCKEDLTKIKFSRICGEVIAGIGEKEQCLLRSVCARWNLTSLRPDLMLF